MKYIGIDTGANTGFAVWDTYTQTFERIDCLKIHVAMEAVKTVIAQNPQTQVVVRFEDARQRRWIPDTHDIRREMGRRQGAGSVKRDSQIWEDFLSDSRITFEMRAPKHNATKMNADVFKAVTKWPKRTNSHERDAAMLVFGENAINFNLKRNVLLQ